MTDQKILSPESPEKKAAVTNVFKHASGASIYALEPRFLFDAAAVQTLGDTMQQAESMAQTDAAIALLNEAGQDAAADSTSNIDVKTDDSQDGDSASADKSTGDTADVLTDSDQDVPVAAATESGDDTTITEVVFIDSTIDNVDDILNSVSDNADVYLLEEGDGIEEVAQILSAYDNLDAVHIMSHGGPGTVYLGTDSLDADTVTGEHADELATIGASLSEDGDILIYGCKVAMGDTGGQLVGLLADATGADVAASSDDTGTGGDWELEVADGTIETAAIAPTGWDGIMADSDGDGVDDSADLDDDGDGVFDIVEDLVGSSNDIAGFAYDGSYTHGASITDSIYIDPSEEYIVIADRNNAVITSYQLSIAGDISSTWTQTGQINVNTLDAESVLKGFSFNNDGTILYYVGQHEGTVFQYALTTAYDVDSIVDDSSPDKTFDITGSLGTSPDPGNLAFSSDGTKMYITACGTNTLYEYTLGTAWDVSSVSSVVSVNLNSVTGVTTLNWTGGFQFNSDGTMLMAGSFSNNTVVVFDLGTAWDINSLSYNQTWDLGSTVKPRAIAFNSDLTNIYVANTDTIYEFHAAADTDSDGIINSLDTDDDGDGILTTTEVAGAMSVTYSSADSVLGDSYLQEIAFSSDGLKFYVADSKQDRILTYTLTTAWDVSTAGGGAAASTQGIDNGISSLSFSSDGYYCYFAGPATDTITQWYLNEAWNLSSGYTQNRINIHSECPSVTDIQVSSDGSTFYALDNSGTLAVYNLDTTNDISGTFTLAYTVDLDTLTGVDLSVSSMYLSNNGGILAIMTYSEPDVYIFSLETPFDMQTLTQRTILDTDGSISGTGNQGMCFSEDMSTLYITGSNTKNVYQFDVTYDTDGDGINNSLDLDSDNDGILDSVEGDIDTDGDGVGNFQDTDSDGDGIDDNVEAQIGSTFVAVTGNDADGDGLDNAYDTDFGGTALDAASVDTDGDTTANYVDNDDDGDGVLSSAEGTADTDGDSTLDYLDTDDDNDTILTSVEKYNADQNLTSLEYVSYGDFGVSGYNTTDVQVTSDGTLMYVLYDGDGTANSMLRIYRLATAYDVTTAFLLDSDTTTLTTAAGSGSYPVEMTLNNTEDTLFILSKNTGTLYQFDVSVDANDTLSLTDTGYSYDCSAMDGALWGMCFGDSGSTFCVIGSYNTIFQYTLASPYDLSGTVTYSGCIILGEVADTISGIEFNTAGTQIAVTRVNSGSAVYIYQLTTAWDINGGMTYLGTVAAPGTGIANQGISFANNSDHMYLCGTGGAIYHYITDNDSDNDGYADYIDIDSDNDGILDSVEGVIDTDTDGVSDYLDTDSDGDGLADAIEPTGAAITLTGDSDGDGLDDAYGAGQTPVDADGDSVVNYLDTDSDGNGLSDGSDGIGDVDGDGVANYIDVDEDNDGILDTVEDTVVSNDLATWVLDDTFELESASSNRGIYFDPSGFYLTVCDCSGTDSITTYQLNTAWDISYGYTAIGSIDPYTLEGEGTVMGVAFNDDGTIVYFTGRGTGDVFQYSLSQAYNVGSIDTDVAVKTTTLTSSVTNIGDITFSSDGYYMYVISATNENINLYTLTTAWDVSTASHTSQNYINNYIPVGITDASDTNGFMFSSDGSQLVVSSYDSKMLYFFDLETAWDLTTLAYTGYYSTGTGLTGVSFNSDMSKIFTCTGGNEIYQYTLVADNDADGVRNSLDLDSDNDGIADNIEAQSSGAGIIEAASTYDSTGVDTAYSGGLTPVDTDGDGVADYLDHDSDGNGINDVAENSTSALTVTASGSDSDGDGIDNNFESTLVTTAAGLTDTDSDGVADYQDLDNDDDGIVDTMEDEIIGFDEASYEHEGTTSLQDSSVAYTANDLCFSADGTLLYIPDYDRNVINCYQLSSAWDTTAPMTYLNQVSTSGITTSLQGVNFGSNGQYIYFIGTSNDTIFQYELGTAWDLSTMSDTETSSLSIASLEGNPGGITFSSDGSKIIFTGTGNTLYQYTLNTAWNVGDYDAGSLVSIDLNEYLPVTVSDAATTHSVYLSDDGSKIMVCRYNQYYGQSYVSVFTLNTAGDLTDGIVFDNQINLNVYDATTEQIARYVTGIYCSPDLDKIYLSSDSSGSANIAQFALVADTDGDGVRNSLDSDSDGDGLSDNLEATGTASPLSGNDANNDGIDDDYGTGLTTVDNDGDGKANFRDIDSDGNGMSDALEGDTDMDGDGLGNYADMDDDGDGITDAIENEGTGNSVYSLQYTGTVSVYAAVNSTETISEVMLSADGNYLYITDSSDGDSVNQYKLSIPYDITSMSSEVDAFDPYNGSGTTVYEGAITSLFISSDGNYVYFAGTGQDTVFQYTLATAWDLSSLSDKKECDISSEIGAVQDISLSEDGSTLYVLDSDGDFAQYALGTAYDVSTATLTGTLNLNDYISADTLDTSASMYISRDGTALAVLDRYDREVFMFSLDTPYDVVGGISFNSVLDLAGVAGVPAGLTHSNGLSGLWFSDDMTTLYVTVNLQDDVYQFELTAYNDTDSDGCMDSQDIDSDNDGILDYYEAQGLYGTDGDFIATSGDDDDHDGLDNAFDVDQNGTAITPVNTDGDSLANYQDTDSDNNGIIDRVEATSSDREADISAFNATDTDGDGLVDMYDDNDSSTTIADSQGAVTPVDTDKDGVADYADIDNDNDGLLDTTEQSAIAQDTDGDTIADYRDIDSDGDGITDLVEAMGTAFVAPADTSTDADKDGLIDAFDSDTASGSNETSLGLTAEDYDTDGVANYLDIDSDNDGITDNVEAQLTASYTAPSGVDSDGDGLDDAYDSDTNTSTTTIFNSAGLTPVNTDDGVTGGDTIADYLDTDSDADGISDLWEAYANDDDSTLDAAVAASADTDGDGLLDVLEGNAADDGYVVYDENVGVDGSGNFLNYNLAAPVTLNGDGSNASSTLDLKFRDANDPPELVDDTATVLEDSLTTDSANQIDVLSNDSDPEEGAGLTGLDPATLEILQADSITYGASLATTEGTWTVQDAVSGIILFSPAANFFGTTAITYRVADNDGAYSTATVTVTVTAVNDAPASTGKTVTITEDTAYTLTVANFTFTDVNDTGHNLLNVIIETLPASGILTLDGTTLESSALPITVSVAQINSGLLKYVPAADVEGAGAASFTYNLQDDGGTDNGGVDTSTSTATITFDITGVNDAPTPVDDTSVDVAEDGTMTFDPLANDTDPDTGDTLDPTSVRLYNPDTFAWVTSLVVAGEGAWSVNTTDGKITFTPVADFSGTYTPVTYQVADAAGATGTAEISGTVTGVDDAVTISDLSGSTVLESDLATGTNPDGDGETATGFFTVTAVDGLTSLDIDGTSFSLAQLNAATESAPLTVTTTSGTLSITGYDADTGRVDYSYTLAPGTAGAAQNVTNDTFAITATDDLNASTDTGNLVITITDGAPEAVADVCDTISIGGFTTSTASGNVLTNDDFGIDGEASPQVTGVVAGTGTPLLSNLGSPIDGTNSYGTLLLNSDGSYTFTTDYDDDAVENLTALDTRLEEIFTYEIADGDGTTSTVTITCYIHGVPALLNTADNTVYTSDGEVAEADMTGGTNDGGGGYTLSGSFYAVVATGVNVGSLTINGTEVIANDSITTTSTVTSANGTLEITGYNSGSGLVSYTYTLTSSATHSGDSLNDDFALSLTDTDSPEAVTVTETLSITILDDAPVTVDDTGAITEDDTNPVTGTVADDDTIGADANATPVNGVVAGTDTTGIDSAGLTATGTYGTLTMNNDGTYSYALDNGSALVQDLQEGEVVTDLFTYQVVDADGDTATATLAVEVTGVAEGVSFDNAIQNSDGTVTTSGTGDPGATITVAYKDLDNNSQAVTTTVAADGTWTVDTASAVDDGSEMQVDQTNTGGLDTDATYIFDDTFVPQTPTIDTVTSDTDGKVTVSGTGEPGTTVNVTYPDGTSDTATVASDGTWSVASTDPQTSGSVTASLTDDGGNTSGTDSFDYTDTTAPLAPALGTTTQETDGTLTVSGTGEPGATVNVTFADGTTGTALVDDAGNWSVTSDSPQTTGTVTATQTDEAGNTSPSDSIEFTDNTQPAAPVVNEPIPQNNDGTLTVSGTGEAGSEVTVTFPDSTTGTAIVADDGTWSVTSTDPQTSGMVTASQTDEANNSSGIETVTYTDGTAPDVPVMNSPVQNADGTLTVSGTGEAGSTVTVTFPDGTTGTAVVDENGDYSVTSTDPQTSGTVTATQEDEAGNTSGEASAAYTDSTAPADPVINTPTQNADGTLTVTGTGEAGSTVTVTLPDGTTDTAVVADDGSWSLTSDTPQSSGTVSAIQTDEAGNSTTPAVETTFTDNQDPLAPVVNEPTQNDDDTLTVTGTGEPGATVTAIFPDASTGTATVAEDGTWSITSADPQTTGDVTVYQTDADNNVSVNTIEDFVDNVVAQNQDGTLTVTGAGEPGTEVTVTFPDGTIAITTVAADGTWSVTSVTPQTDGDVVLDYTDVNGDAAGETIPFDDNTAPDVPGVSTPVQNTDGTLTVSGTGEAGSTVTVTFPDGTTGTAVVADDGTYSVTSVDPQTSGTVTVSQTDEAGNTSGEQPIDFIDGTAPATPVVNAPAQNSDGTLTVSGTGEPGSTVTVEFPDGTTGTAVVADDGSYSVTSDDPQTSGTVSVFQTDEAGNTSGTQNVTFDDTTAPSAPVANAPVQNSDGTLTASGTGEAGSTVNVTFPDGSTGSVVVADDGTWSVTSDDPQTTGNVVVTQTDEAGNTSGNDTVTFTDGTAPATPVVDAPVQNTDGTLTVSGTGEAGSTVTVEFPDGSTGTAEVAADGTYSVTSTDPQTTGTVSVSQTDEAGNTSGTQQATFTDLTVPDVPGIGTIAPETDGTLTVSGTGEAGATVTVEFPDGSTGTAVVAADGTWSVTSDTPQTSGDVTVSQTDEAGNTSGQATDTFTDNTAPVAPGVNAPVQNSDGTLTVSGTGEPGATVTVTFKDGSTGTALVGDDGTWSLVSDMPQSSGNLTVTQEDAAGNDSPDTTVTFTDTTAPATPVLNDPYQNADETLTVSGLGEAGSTVTVFFADGTTDTANVAANGTWSVTSANAQTSGEVTAYQTDKNNNVSGTATEQFIDNTVQQNTDGTLTVSGDVAAGANLVIEFPDGSTATINPLPTSYGDTLTITYSDGSTGSVTFAGDGDYTITLNDGSTCEVSVGADGTFSVTSKTPQTSGYVDINVNGSIEETLTYVDNTAPLPPTIDSGSPTQENDGTMTVAGTGEPGSQVTVEFADGTIGTATVAANGTYTVTSTTAQTTGTVKVYQTDEAGNQSGTLQAAWTDLTAPDAPVISSAGQNADGSLTVTGTGEAGATVDITYEYVDPHGVTQTVTASTTVDENGDYSLDLPAPVTDGTISATQTDEAGNVSVTSGSFTYTDTTPPSDPTVNQPIPQNDDGSVTVSGTGEAGATVTIIYDDGNGDTQTVTTVVGDDGTYTIDLDAPITDTSLTVKQTDQKGQDSGEVAVLFDDTTAPSVPDDMTVTPEADGTITVSGQGDEPGSTIEVTFPDGSTGTVEVAADGTWSVTSDDPQTSGEVSVTQEDAAGNVSGTGTISYEDSTAPTAPVVDTPVQNPDGSLTVTGTGEPGTTVTATYTGDDGTTQTATATVDENGNYELDLDAPITDGDVSVILTDDAGNTSDATQAAFDDTTAPSTPVVNQPIPQNDDGTLTVSGTGEPGANITVTFPDGSEGTVEVGDDGTWSVTSDDPQTDGTLIVGQTDDAGNPATPSASVIFEDNTAPSVPGDITITPEADGSITIDGTGEPGATVEVTFPDGTTGTVPVDDDGTWSITSDSSQPEGNVGVSQTDEAGNESGTTVVEYDDMLEPMAPSIDEGMPVQNDDGTLTVAGEGEPGATVEVTFPDGSTGTVVVGDDSTWSITSDTAQTSGTLTVTQTDDAGNTSDSTDIEFVDTTPPAVPEVGKVTQNDDGTVTADGTGEPGSTVTVTYPDGSVVTVIVGDDGTWSTTSADPQPSGTITLFQTDEAGNVSGQFSQDFISTYSDAHFNVNALLGDSSRDSAFGDQGSGSGNEGLFDDVAGHDNILLRFINQVRSLNGHTVQYSDPDDFLTEYRQRNFTTVNPIAGGVHGHVMTWEADGTASFYAGSQHGRFSVETTSMDNALYVDVFFMDSQAYKIPFKEIQATMGDGSALPDWIAHVKGNMLIAYPPVGVEEFSLKVTGIAEDGSWITKQFKIDLLSGEITAMDEEDEDERLDFSASVKKMVNELLALEQGETIN